MNNTQIILIVGFISIGVVLYLGLDNLAKNQPKSEFEACMEKTKEINFDKYNNDLMRILICNGIEI